VCVYLLVRCVHLTVYPVAATGDPELWNQLAIALSLLASAALLVPGVLLGGWMQTLMFAGASSWTRAGVYLTSRHGQLASAQCCALDRRTRPSAALILACQRDLERVVGNRTALLDELQPLFGDGAVALGRRHRFRVQRPTAIRR
jgi:hypothetical protein